MANVGSILQVQVAGYQSEGTPGQYPIQRRHQWYKDGVPVPGHSGLALTPTEPGTYTVSETSFYLSRSPTGGFIEGTRTTTTSAPMVVTGTVDPALVYSKDLEWLGSFRPPSVAWQQGMDWRDFNIGLSSLAFNPAGNGGQGSLFGTAHSGYSVGEFTIPTPSKTLPPFATLLTLPTVVQDPTNGQFSNSGVTSGTSYSIGLHVHANRLLVTYSGNYSYSDANWFWSRPLDLNSTTDIRGPFSVRGAFGERFHAGYIADVPPELRTKLGGPLICGLSADSIQSATSDGPPIASFDPALFTTTNAVRGTFGTITGNTFVLPSGSGTPGAYVGWRIMLQNPTNNAQQGIVRNVIAYDSATKVVTVEDLPVWVANGVGAATAFVMVPKVTSTALAMYPLYTLQNYLPYGKYCGIWTETSSKIGEAVIPNGTRSVLLFGLTANGRTQYAIPSGSSYDAGEVSGDGFRVYDPEGGARGEHGYPYAPRIWAYDTNDLEQAKLGNIPPQNVKPYAVIDFKMPDAVFAAGGRFTGGVTYDPKTRRLYVGASSGAPGYEYGQRVIHVFQVNNAVAVP
jgi:hypothetical protein